MAHMGDLNTVADVVITAHDVIEEHGTHEMKAMIRMLLLTIGREIAQSGGLAKVSQALRRDEIE
ncbi:hypothetical protein [Methylobacterium sp. J-068]|uniref:hypothetical protein n=1 Tax=Methylobacterium sp. J-068 TaxID=2836649 RepID=UPI001FBAEB75|nr:hypothetical protein [Methylobacterium sp. J-068]MCJ2035968.1 hypothetical protein [Methylobacterium sp. J-068]